MVISSRLSHGDIQQPNRARYLTQLPMPFSDSAVSYVKVSYLVHEVLLLSSSRNYILLNCYHDLCAVNYTSTHVFAPK
jgi:hypothetical protein